MISGERTRLACWFRRLAETDFDLLAESATHGIVELRAFFTFHEEKSI